MNIPNLLSLLRLAMIPFFCYYFTLPDNKGRVIGAIIFALAGFTDILDGYMARKYNQTTELGKILDPLADKLMQIAAFVCMYIIPLWVLPIMFVKEALMLIGSAKMISEGKKVPSARWYGKLATAVLFISVILIMCFYNIPPFLSAALITISLLFAIFAFLSYLRLYFIINKEDTI